MATYIIVVLSVWVIFSERLYPNVTIAGEHYAYKTKSQIKKDLEKRISELEDKNIIVGDKKMATKELKLKYDLDSTLKKALAVGQENPFGLFTLVDIPLVYNLDQAKLYQSLKNVERSALVAVKDPIIQNENYFLEGSNGVRLNYAETVASLDKLLKNGQVETIQPVYYAVGPTFKKESLTENRVILDSLPEKLTLLGPESYVVTKKEMYSWVSPEGESLSLVNRFGDDFLVAPLWSRQQGNYNLGQVEEALLALAVKINLAPQNALLGVAEGKVAVIKPEINGRELEVAKSAQKITNALELGEDRVELVISGKKPVIRSDNLTELGLTQLISTGYSNFSGSPANRIHNVRTGASKFNGAIIAPGAEFSFNGILGPVEASTGYLPELVILENKTEPQFGGGLCQVSSTAFRAALNAGFPILERKAHAYPVSYYKPFGVDASIYLPKPDFRFRNDSQGYLLVQTRIVGKNLYFDFYGTKKNRRVAFAAGADAKGAVPVVEKVSPYIYDQGARGKGSFSAMFYRFIYDEKGKLISSKYFLSKYDSPDKYPH